MGIISDNCKFKDLKFLRIYGFYYRRINNSWNITFIKSIPTDSTPWTKLTVGRIIIYADDYKMKVRFDDNYTFIMSINNLKVYVDDGEYQKFITHIDKILGNCLTEYTKNCFNKLYPNGAF